MRTRNPGLPSGLLLTIVLVTAAVADDAAEKPTAEDEAVTALRRGIATNIQFHREGGVRLVRLSKPIVTDEHLVHLREFKKIDYLAVLVPTVTDAGLENIRELKELDTLVLSGSGVTDAGMAHLANLTKLERLYLDDTAVTDKGLAQLEKLTVLKVLSLKRTAITDDGLARLEPLVNLESLFLDGTKITDEGLTHLQPFEKLGSLYLNETAINGSGFANLTKFKKLESLNITGTNCTAAAVDPLTKLKSLKLLTAYDTSLAQADVDKLGASLPKLAVYGVAKVPANAEAVADSTVPAGASQNKHVASSKVLQPARERFTSRMVAEVPDFQRHVIPLFGRLGCNGRACHGSFQGKGGFRLSMFGYDFGADHEALAGGDEPRVNVDDPKASLILNKPTSEENHGGGKRFDKDGWEYQILSHWISAGAPGWEKERAAVFDHLEVTPAEIVFSKDSEERPLSVIAVWSDGTREDVTCLTRFQSNDEGVATVTTDGLVKSKGKGDTHIVAFYDNGIQPIPVIRPVSDLTDERYPDVPTPTRIDELVVEKLAKLGIVPSELCSDEEFLRRVSLDMIATLPTPAEIEAFVADSSPDKRARKIDELLEHPAYITWWTQRLCDLTGSNAGYLGGTEMAQTVAGQWRAWLERRVRDNVSYDQIVEGIVTATSRRPGQAYEDYVVEQSTYTRRQDPADYAAPGNPMSHFWYRDNISKPEDKALAFGYIFLGVRLQCAQCHKHPFDQWSKQDFELFTEFFTRIKKGQAPDAAETHKRLAEKYGVPVKLNTAALRRQSYMRIAAEGNPIPWNEVYIERPGDKPQPAKLLGGKELDLNQFDDPREPLMAWLKATDNPYFARAFVNRIWANYFNVGIVDPPDDMNMANPPSNKPLLDYLAAEFVAHNYDMKWLHRTIANSRTYQLSWRPTETNRNDDRNFSHAIVRRLPAEAVVDAIDQATANDKFLSTVSTNVAGRNIDDHPRSFQATSIDYSLLIFGKPLRTTNCDCERQTEPTLLQALYVRNDGELLKSIQRKEGWIAQIQADKETATPTSDVLVSMIETAYLRTLSRKPTEQEIDNSRVHIEESESVHDGLADLLWALLNSQEFITNH